jgi:hypothetical protein
MYDRWSNNVRSLSFYSSHLKFEFEREELSWGRESKVPIQPVVALGTICKSASSSGKLLRTRTVWVRVTSLRSTGATSR